MLELPEGRQIFVLLKILTLGTFYLSVLYFFFINTDISFAYNLYFSLHFIVIEIIAILLHICTILKKLF